jgi:hypothetical protein
MRARLVGRLDVVSDRFVSGMEVPGSSEGDRDRLQSIWDVKLSDLN